MVTAQRVKADEGLPTGPRRFECLQQLGAMIDAKTIVVTSIGGVRVEWHAVRPSPLNYNVHNLGLASSVALGMAVALPERDVICLDGDASALANLGGLVTAGYVGASNLVHIVFDNRSHESCGGIPTATSSRANLHEMACGAGLLSRQVHTVDEFAVAFGDIRGRGGFIHCIVKSAVEPGVGAVPYDFTELKFRFMRALPEAVSMLEVPPPSHMVASGTEGDK
jgi:sulfopyruvate decarboxylase subunit beta